MDESAATSTQNYAASRLRHASWQTVDDCLVVEEPLEIRIEGRRYTATMRTPGHDLHLARGLLFTEGVIAAADDIERMTYSTHCRELSDELVNVVNVVLHDSDIIPAHLWERSLISNSSCGLCGKASVDALTARVTPLPHDATVSSATLLRLPHVLREHQQIFERTGGLHAAGIFNTAGEPLAIYEDIGRHNATDKAIGRGLEEGWLPWDAAHGPAVLMVSGRASFEIVQKALMARLPVVCSVSAASTLAVDLAAANNQTLIGFLRETGFTVYAGPGRVADAAG